jgi:hypothetical protein
VAFASAPQRFDKPDFPCLPRLRDFRPVDCFRGERITPKAMPTLFSLIPTHIVIQRQAAAFEGVSARNNEAPIVSGKRDGEQQ